MRYFFLRNTDHIVCSDADNFCESEHPQLTELSVEQYQFFEQHPTAKAHEVQQGFLDSNPPVAPLPALETYKATKIEELSFKSLQYISNLYPDYQVLNALLGVYPDSDAKITDIKSLSEQCREEFYRLKNEISNAQSHEEIDNIYNSNKYDSHEIVAQ